MPRIEPCSPREEVESAQARGWTIVGVGPRILRTETAGPAIIAVLQARFGDLGVA
jgi:16S rRNA (uracil1498-N3)-methyltransferase